MDNVEVQETIVETTLMALTASEESALRGTFGGATSISSRRRRLSTTNRSGQKALLEITTMLVIVSYTLEDFSYSSPEQAMDAFREKFADSWGSGDFLSSFSTILLRKNPSTKIKINNLSQISNIFSGVRVFNTGFNPTAKPTSSPAPTAQPSTGMLHKFFYMYCINLLLAHPLLPLCSCTNAVEVDANDFWADSDLREDVYHFGRDVQSRCALQRQRLLRRTARWNGCYI